VLPALPVVFPAEGEVRLLGFDAYYHLRHASFAAKHFPELQRWDVGTHYPNGQRSDAAGLFDLSIAAFAIAIAGGVPDEGALFRAAAWLPPLLLLLAFPVVLWVLLRNTAAALAASVLLYALVWEFGWNLPSYPSGHWVFNPLAWQLLFVFGAWCALGGATRLAPDSPNAFNNLGGAYLYMGEFDKAAGAFARSLALEPRRGRRREQGLAPGQCGRRGASFWLRPNVPELA